MARATDNGLGTGLANDYTVEQPQMTATVTLPDFISHSQTTEERFLRHTFVRDQMAPAKPL
jgi:hypothetical protein